MTETSLSKDFTSSSETSKFLLSFIQALLKTGYYTSGHPETSKARKDLYNSFQTVISGHKELTFILASVKDTRDIMVDGIVDEPVAMSVFFLKEMAEMFLPKFLAYFDRKNLSSFSIKAAVTEDEFEAFIDLMSESPAHETNVDTREKLYLDLLNKNVLHVSTVFNIDLVGKERKLPWRVEIALTRLKKDLSLIPLYKNLNNEKMIELKNMVFDDIIRPIKSHDIIKDILVNLDIISPDIAGISKDEFEDRVTDYINKGYLFRAAPEILKFLVFLKESFEKIHDDHIMQRLKFTQQINKKVALKIISYGFTEEALLLDYFNHNVLELSELPENIRNKIKRREEIQYFLKDPQKYFADLERADTREKLQKSAILLLNLLPELFIKNFFNEAEEILINIHRAGYDYSSVDRMLLDEIVISVVQASREGTKENQMKIVELTDWMGETGIIILNDFLTHKSRMIRKLSCDKLFRHGKSAISVLRNSLGKRKDWFYIRNALMILAEIGRNSPDLEQIYRKFMNHEEPKVRVDAITGIVNLLDSRAEEILIKSLGEESHPVRKKAIWGLGKIHSVAPEVMTYFIETISGRRNEVEPVVEQVLLSIRSYPRHLDEAKKLEQAILELLSKEIGKLGRFGTKSVLSENIRLKMCGTLSCIGSGKSIDVLKKIAKKDRQAIKTKALEAIEKIQQSGQSVP
jgi:HEAT repeat protein